MGAMGSDIAARAADIALMTDDLSRLVYLKRLARATVWTIRGEFVYAIAFNAAMIALALAPYRHPDIDIPEGTITTDVYLHDIYITLYLKK